MPYVDPQSVHNPATGTIAPAAWGDTIRDDLEFLVDPPACSVFHSVVQSTSSGVSTALAADSENFDNAGMHSTVTNNSRITIQVAGRYLLLATMEFANNATGWRSTGFFINGVFSPIGGQTVPPAGSQTTRLSATRTRVLAVGDYVEVQSNQNSGVALNVGLAEFGVVFLTR
jgi:hypothetical protein